MTSPEQLRQILEQVRNREYAEISLELGDHRVLTLLLWGKYQCAMLCPLNFNEGFHSAALLDTEVSERQLLSLPPSLDFLLPNGQVDEYQREWMLPFPHACDALVYFLLQGELGPFVHWSDGNDISPSL